MKTSQLFIPTAKDDETVTRLEVCPKCDGTGTVPVTGCCPVCRGRKTRIVLVEKKPL